MCEPVNTRDTAVWVRGILWCAKVHYRTRTRSTRFGNTAGKPVPVAIPSYVCPLQVHEGHTGDPYQVCSWYRSIHC